MFSLSINQHLSSDFSTTNIKNVLSFADALLLSKPISYRLSAIFFAKTEVVNSSIQQHHKFDRDTLDRSSKDTIRLEIVYGSVHHIVAKQTHRLKLALINGPMQIDRIHQFGWSGLCRFDQYTVEHPKGPSLVQLY